MDAIFALISALTTAVYLVYTSGVMKRTAGLPSTLVLAVSHLMAALMLLPFWLARGSSLHLPMGTALSLLGMAGLLVLARELYFYAYAHTDIANITIFSALTPVYALIAAFLFLGEVPGPLQLAGLLLICASIYGLFLPDTQKPLLRMLWRPFANIAGSKPILFAFLSTIPTAFAALFQKQLLTTLDPVSLSFFLLLLIGVFAFIITLFLHSPAEIASDLRRIPPHFLLISAMLLPVMHVLFCVVMINYHTAVALALQRSSMMFQIMLGYVCLRERDYLRRRLLACVAILCGFVLMAL